MKSVAFVFSAQQLDVVVVDTATKQFIEAFSQSLPAGAVIRGKIVQMEAVVQAVQELSARLSVKPDHVSIVIPEDAVISKSITLPKLPKNDISEAVRWEAESFLPYGLEEAVIDYQILSNGDKLHILFQSVPSQMVDAYLMIFEKLNIVVDAVETPAIAMVRLAEKKPGVRLLIHVSTTEAVLTLAKDKEIVATSVIAASPQLVQSIEQTIVHMSRYYKEFPLEWIQIGGLGVSSTVVNRLAKLKLPMAGFSLPVTVKPAIANSYLLAISAASFGVEPPSDQGSINLLALWYEKKQYRRKQTAFFSKVLWFACFYLGIICIALTGTYLWLFTQIKTLKAQQNDPTAVKLEVLEAAGTANQLSQTVINLAEGDKFPNDLVDTIYSLSKSGIQLGQVALFLPENRGELMGMATNRSVLVAFRQEMENLSEIEKAELPVSSFAEEENIPFQMQFTLVTKNPKKK